MLQGPAAVNKRLSNRGVLAGISVTASYPFLKFSPPVHKIGMERRVSQIFHLGLSFHFMTKKRVTLCTFFQNNIV